MKSYFCALYLLAFVSAASAQDLPRGHPQVDAQKPSATAPNLSKKGKVLSTIEVPQYSYIEVMQDQKPQWLATTSIPVKTGDTIRFEEGVVMTNFYSNALKRSFPVISFVGTVVVSDDKE